mmetsp:Transcript_119380/g.337739  ORF Transcript_119380/g.337739 Transcript_119380/m.337739 type:complete len:274 (-) Transcript_119380:232-1053(-)
MMPCCSFAFGAAILFLHAFSMRHSASIFFCFSAKINCRTRSLNLSDGSPIMTLATRRKLWEPKRRSISARSDCSKFPRTSITTKSSCCSGATSFKTLRTLPSSMAVLPYIVPGLSRDPCFEDACTGVKPLLAAQLPIIRSLISMWPGCFSKNMSSHSKAPWSGRKTGKMTSRLRSDLGGSSTTASAHEASCTIRHLKGRGTKSSGPKFTCRSMFLKVTVGYSGFPNSRGGSSRGGATRTPSLKTETVPAVAPMSTFSTIVSTPPLRRTVLVTT